jgi:hypothetical protein
MKGINFINQTITNKYYLKIYKKNTKKFMKQ